MAAPGRQLQPGVSVLVRTIHLNKRRALSGSVGNRCSIPYPAPGAGRVRLQQSAGTFQVSILTGSEEQLALSWDRALHVERGHCPEPAPPVTKEVTDQQAQPAYKSCLYCPILRCVHRTQGHSQLFQVYSLPAHAPLHCPVLEVGAAPIDGQGLSDSSESWSKVWQIRPCLSGQCLVHNLFLQVSVELSENRS